MEVINYFEVADKGLWLEQINKCDWSAGKYLGELLSDEDKLRELLGRDLMVLLLTEGEELISFCTLAGRDEIDTDVLKPWIGFVYTFPERRGNHMAGRLLEGAARRAQRQKHPYIYISTEYEGLFEKYDFGYVGSMVTIRDTVSRVYRKGTAEKA